MCLRVCGGSCLRARAAGCEVTVLFTAAGLRRVFDFLTLAHPCLHTTGEGAQNLPQPSYLDLNTQGLELLWGGPYSDRGGAHL